jgi:hypothetical protein
MRALVTAVAVASVSACGGSPTPEQAPADRCEQSIDLRFSPEIGDQGVEAYICFGFDADSLDGALLAAVRWVPTAVGGMALHHATLKATAENYPDGPVECGAMPADAIGLHVWAPGGTPLELPPDVGLALPEGVRRFIVEAHVLRTSAEPAGPSQATLCKADPGVIERAGWVGVQAPVPAIRPHHVETSSGRCAVPGPLRVAASWPHMHRVGAEFHGAIVRADGSRQAVIDLLEWDFDDQRTYPIDVELQAGDAIETTCVWENATDEYVLPGPLTSDEMCNQGLIAWPAEHARCVE